MMQNEKISTSRILISVVLSCLIFITSCEKNTYKIDAGDPSTPVLFKTQIQPIFDANCIRCHGTGRQPDLSAANSYKSLTQGGYVSQPAESSKLYKQVNSGHGNLPIADRFKILYWIQQGAKNN
jgi:hypothetical protein